MPLERRAVLPAIDMRLRPPAGPFLSLPMFRVENGLAARLRQRGYTPPESLAACSLDALFAEMDEAGIDASVVAARAPTSDDALSNAAVAELVSAHRDRLIGFIGAVALDPDVTASDLDECVRLGAIGIAVEPGLAKPPMRADDARLLPVYSAAASRGLPIFVTGGDSGPDTAFASPLWLERASAAVPVAEFVAVHGGWPYVREMVAVALRRHNVWVMPDMYAAHFPGHRDYTEAANGLLRDRILFATSYPAVNIVEYVRALREDGLTDEAWRAIAVDNPHRFLRRGAAAPVRTRVTP